MPERPHTWLVMTENKIFIDDSLQKLDNVAHNSSDEANFVMMKLKLKLETRIINIRNFPKYFAHS